VVGAQGEVSLQAGWAVFVPPQEEHQFINRGSEPLVFLCVVPSAVDG
jgi:mannose-6-phosphate isomerase-like protein (cupin superfamily)